MKYFHFRTPTIDINEPLAVEQCEFIKKDGTRCKRKVCIGLPHCYSHKIIEYDLKVKESTIPHAGLGLFAYDPDKRAGEIVFKPNTKLCPYEGDVVPAEEIHTKFGEYTAPYAIQLNRGMIEDGSIERGIGTLINHKPMNRTNCKFSVTRNNRVWIVSTKNIRNHEELFVSYGREYRMNERGVRTSTNNNKYKI
jgi:hypothetical protein